ncbi:MAG TPA: hypothetical protein VGR35_01125 [Tepidisphaeraceae bacterium]|nr:hypothetical protein [Tepidisphaeraceae bacterium]
MKRLAGNLFTLCSVVSILLLVATACLWLSSAFDGTFIHTSPLKLDGRTARRVEWRIGRLDGRVFVNRVEATYTDPQVIRSQAKSLTGWGHLPTPPAFAMYTGSTQQAGWGWVARVRGVSFPLPPAVVLTAVLPTARLAVFLRRRRRWRWKAAGCCANCGYDLRATHGCCPECGAVPEAPAGPPQ